MTDANFLPGWDEVVDGASQQDSPLPAEYLESLSPAERADAVARWRVNSAIGEAWIFPAVVVDDAVTYLFGRHDIDVEGDRGVRLSDPLGLVRVDGADATIEWRWSATPEAATEDTAPAVTHPHAGEAMLVRPMFEQVALTDELFRRATEAAVATVAGVTLGADATGRLADLFAFATPNWLAPFYIEAGAEYLRSLGWDPNAASAGVPPVDAANIASVIPGALGPPESMVLTTDTGLAAALAELGIIALPHSPIADLPTGDHPGNVGLADVAAALRALAAPDWLVQISGLADTGYLDCSIAMADIDGEMIWTGISAADGAVAVSPDADPAAVVAMVEAALDASGIAPQGPVVMPLNADHMTLFAAVADEHAASGGAAFTAEAGLIQRHIDDPSPSGTLAAVTQLANPPDVRLDDGFGLTDYLTIDDGAVFARPMIRTWAGWLTRPRARLTITLTDFNPPDGDEPISTGYSFVRSDDGLFVFAVTDPIGPGGVESDRRIDVAAVGTDVLHQMVNGLLGM